MRAEIISVGTELLLGDIVNTNAQFLAQQLAGLGYSVFYQTVVGDNAMRLRRLVLEAKERSDILIFTGGLGPTDDDLTKQTVAEAFGDTLVLDTAELDRLVRFFRKRGFEMTENNKKQAMVPRLGQKLPNANGTAPGAFFRQGRKYAFLLPGPPREMQPMFLEQVAPILQEMQDSAIRSLTLRVFGIGESSLEDRVRTLLDGDNPTAALYAKTGEVHIRITARAATAEQADVMCDEYADLFRTALGEWVYSDNGDDQETTLVKLLLATDKTLATAESCTGGLLGERITSVPGASAIYGYGSITYANEAKHDMLGVRNGTLRRHGAVSSQAAAEMAFGAADRGNADYGVAITGIAGPGGGSAEKPVGLVYIAVSSGREVYIKKMNFGRRDRGYIRELATNNALDMLRRLVLGHSIPDAKRFTRAQQADFEREGRPRRRGGAFGRAVTAILLVAVVFALVMLGIWYAQSSGERTDTAAGDMPSAQGLRYGTVEYAAAAHELVRLANQQNPAVAGFVALPDAGVETLVAQSTGASQAELAPAQNEAGTEGLPLMAAGALPGKSAQHTVLLGNSASFAPLLAYQDGTAAASLSTFLYCTQKETRTYQVFAVYLADEGTAAPDGFDPLQLSLASYDDFLHFVLGARIRSLYDIPVDLLPGDSFMTLAVADAQTPGRYLYLCGRLVRSGEVPATESIASAAGDALMPSVWYAEQGKTLPDIDALYTTWLQCYLWRDVDNSSLQLRSGMPAADTAPMQQAGTENGGTATGATRAAAALLPGAAASTNTGSSSSSGESQSGSSGSSSGSSSSSSSSTSSGGSSSSSDGSTSSGSSDVSTEDSSLDPSMQEQSSLPPVSSTPTLPQPLPQRAGTTTLTVTLNGRRTTADTAVILAQICQAEAATLRPAAIQALAVAAHSWILNQHGAGVEAPTVVGRPAGPDVLNAVYEVEHLILSANGKAPAFTPWFEMAAFGTNLPQNLWGVSRDYLVSVPSAYEQSLDGWRQIATMPHAEFAAIAAELLTADLFAYGAPESWFSELEKNDGGYVEGLLVGDVSLDGLYFWQNILLRDDETPLLASPAFEVEFDGENFVFISYGRGHGCGLSLAGADSLARQGQSVAEILAHYFPGTEIMTWD